MTQSPARTSRFEARPNAALTARRERGSRARCGGAGLQRGSDARRLGVPPAPPSARPVPVSGAHHDRGQRQRRRHAPHRRGTRRRARRRPGRAARAEGAWARAARGVVDLGRPGAGVHGRRPVDRPGRTRASCRAADLRPLRPGDRDPAGPGCARGARTQARDHLALLQLHSQVDARRALLRRAVRVQGHPRRRRAPPASACHRHRLVFRHRTAGAGRTSGSAHPRSAGGLGGRHGQPGRHRGDRGRRPQGHRAAAARLHVGLDTRANCCGTAGFVTTGGRRQDRCCARRCGSRASGSPPRPPTCCCS